MKAVRISIVAGLFALCAAPALAAEGEGFIAEHHLLIENLAAVFNFVIFAWVLLRFAGPKVKAMFQSGADAYHVKVQEAADALAAAEEAHAQWAKRFDAMQEELDDVRETARQLAESQARQIIEDAKKQAERLVADAERSAEDELRQSVDQLRAEMADRVLAKAETLLQGRLTPSHQKMLIEEAIKKLEARQ
ncbi:MAG: ATP synthase F0 subunit B [Candidatus Lernaella stagnicola]|nr:ATP synthase F0 subunit B [Candidatus Lernaella stagnicola]